MSEVCARCGRSTNEIVKLPECQPDKLEPIVTNKARKVFTRPINTMIVLFSTSLTLFSLLFMYITQEEEMVAIPTQVEVTDLERSVERFGTFIGSNELQTGTTLLRPAPKFLANRYIAYCNDYTGTYAYPISSEESTVLIADAGTLSRCSSSELLLSDGDNSVSVWALGVMGGLLFLEVPLDLVAFKASSLSAPSAVLGSDGELLPLDSHNQSAGAAVVDEDGRIVGIVGEKWVNNMLDHSLKVRSN